MLRTRRSLCNSVGSGHAKRAMATDRTSAAKRVIQVNKLTYRGVASPVTSASPATFRAATERGEIPLGLTVVEKGSSGFIRPVPTSVPGVAVEPDLGGTPRRDRAVPIAGQEGLMVTLRGDARDAGFSGTLLAMSWESIARRGIDLVAAAIGLLVLLVPMIVIGLLIRASSTGPALFRQERVGFGGRTFTMFKFRTMRTGSGDEMLRELIAAELRGEDTSSNGSFKLDDDPRVTKVGNFLRKTSLDELPQLINVIVGNMSLVGPRPCLVWEARMFPAEFRARFSVRPGLTGLWQVSGRSTMGTLEMLHLDLTYVRTRRLIGDLSILARTIPSMLRDHSAR